MVSERRKRLPCCIDLGPQRDPCCFIPLMGAEATVRIVACGEGKAYVLVEARFRQKEEKGGGRSLLLVLECFHNFSLIENDQSRNEQVV